MKSGRSAGCRWIPICVWLCCCVPGGVLPALAELPAVEVQVDTTMVRLGDPVQLTVQLRHRRETLPELPELEEWLEDFTLRPGGRSDLPEVDGVQETVHRFELRRYELGTQRIPTLEVNFIQAAGDTLVRASQPLDIEVVSARTEDDQELRDIKPPVVVPGGIPLWLAVLLVGAVLILIGGGIFWALRRRGKGEEEEPLSDPVDHAAEFIRIAGMGLLEEGNFKRFYSLLADNLRRFLEQSLEVEAMEQTTGEIATSLKRIELGDDLIREAEEYLSFADLVKFARLVPELDRARRAPEGGLAILRAIDRFATERRRGMLQEVEPPSSESQPAPAGDAS
jgi:hypothetical protein